MTALTETRAAGEVDGLEVRAYPIDNLRDKGHWVARIMGPSNQYVVERAFLQGSTKGRERHYGPGAVGDLPAWVIRAAAKWCDSCGSPSPVVELIAATEIGWTVITSGLSSRDLLAVFTSGPPGADPAAQVVAALDDSVEVYRADLEAPF